MRVVVLEIIQVVQKKHAIDTPLDKLFLTILITPDSQFYERYQHHS